MGRDTRDGSPRGLAAEGESAPADELRRRLPTAPPAYLEGAVHNPRMTEREVVLLLRNRTASAGVLTRVARNPAWTGHYEVLRGVVRHPRTPAPVASTLVDRLLWRDAVDTIRDRRLHPALRRQATRRMRERLPELTRGEQVALARRAPGELIGDLRESGDPRVLLALIDNPELRQEDAASIAARATRGLVLERIARHPRWGRQHDVRSALLGNARTPVPTSLRLVAATSHEELIALADDERVPNIVRVGAERRLQSLERRGSKDATS